MPPMGMQGESNSPLNLSYVFQALVTMRSEPKTVIAQQIEKKCGAVIFFS